MTKVLLVQGHEADAVVRRGVRELLAVVDDEFVPPLSRRTDTISTEAVARPSDSAPVAYLETMLEESWLIAVDGDDVCGLLSFRTGHGGAGLPGCSPSLYATTVAVAPAVRRARVGTALYDALERRARELRVPYLTTRTWTTNTSHLDLLRARGFWSVAELPDHRDSGVGTVYLAYAVASVGS